MRYGESSLFCNGFMILSVVDKNDWTCYLDIEIYNNRTTKLTY